ncbi:MAG: P-loop NTPase fold protein [Desulfocapsaceae bacterium]|nr:P-loop NTPase fold protein [Desulfocapsaceae bacterium]
METDKYSSDTPVHTAAEDKFSRWAFAERVADVISERKGPSPITIGLYGPWGDGKTSVLNFIEESIKTKGSVIVVRFNPWIFGNVESLLLGFFNVLADALDTELITKGEKLKDFLKKTAPGIASFAGMKGIGDAVGSFLHGPSITQLRERIENELEKSQKRILVMIDDVDRLEKAEIYAIFKLVKLVADFKFTAYLLAFDKAIVASSLSENYSGAHEKSGEQFLEKIIQVPLHLPAVPDKDLRHFCFQGVDEALNSSEISLSEQQVQEFARDFTRAFDENLTTPRKAKLYGNILMFSLPILKGEVNPVDLMLIEGLRVFVPELYDTIRKNKDSFAGAFRESMHTNTEPEKQRIKELIDNSFSLAGIKQPYGYIELLKNIFPKIKSVYGNMSYGSDWYQIWDEGQRICASGYFDRYFTYSVPKGDFPDTALTLLVEKVHREKCKLSSNNNPLSDVLTPENSGALIRKLRNKSNILNEDESIALSLAISYSAGIFPNPESMFGWDAPHTQAAMLVSDLIQNVDNSKRVDIIKECIDKSATIAFQLEIFRWLRREDQERPEKDSFPEKDITNIARHLAKSLENYLKSSVDVTVESSRIAPQIFYILNQYSKNKIAFKHVMQVLDADNSAVIRLLDLYTPTAWGMESGVSHKSNFERDQYDSVTKIFDPDFILSYIERYLGNLPEDQKNFPRDFDQEGREIVLHQFVWIHRRVLQENSKEEA